MSTDRHVVSIEYVADATSLLNVNKQLIKQVNQLNAALAASNTVSAGERGRVNRSLASDLSGLRNWGTQAVAVESQAIRLGKALEANNLSWQRQRQLLSEYRKSAVGARGAISDLAKEQVRMSKASVTVYEGRGGRQMANVTVPAGVDMGIAGNRTKVASEELRVYNRLLAQNAESWVNWGKNTQWAGRQIMVGLTIPMTMFAQAAKNAFIEVDKELTRLGKVYGATLSGGSAAATEQIKKETSELAGNLASSWGVAAKETAGIAADIAATGKEGQELLDSTKEAIRLSVLGEVNRQDAMKATLALQSAFRLNTEELTQSINFLNAVENQTSTSLSDLIEAIPRTGPVIQAFGGDVKDLALLLTAMREGGVDAAEAANAIKSGLASLVNPTKQASEQARGFGIDLVGIVEANRGQLIPTIMALKGELDKLDSFSRGQLLETIFGKYQLARLTALFDNIGRVGSQTETVMQLMGSSTADMAAVAEKELTALTESASMKWQRAVESFKFAIQPIGETVTKVFTTALNVITKVIEGFNDLPDPIKKVLGGVAGFAALVGPFLMIGGIIGNFIGNIMKGLNFLRRGFKGPESMFSMLTAETMAAEEASRLLSQAHFNESAALAELNAVMAEHIRLQQTILGAGGYGPNGGGPLPGGAGGPVPTGGGPGAPLVPFVAGSAMVPTMASKHGYVPDEWSDKVWGGHSLGEKAAPRRQHWETVSGMSNEQLERVVREARFDANGELSAILNSPEGKRQLQALSLFEYNMSQGARDLPNISYDIDPDFARISDPDARQAALDKIEARNAELAQLRDKALLAVSERMPDITPRELAALREVANEGYSIGATPIGPGGRTTERGGITEYWRPGPDGGQVPLVDPARSVRKDVAGALASIMAPSMELAGRQALPDVDWSGVRSADVAHVVPAAHLVDDGRVPLTLPSQSSYANVTMNDESATKRGIMAAGNPQYRTLPGAASSLGFLSLLHEGLTPEVISPMVEGGPKKAVGKAMEDAQRLVEKETDVRKDNVDALEETTRAQEDINKTQKEIEAIANEEKKKRTELNKRTQTELNANKSKTLTTVQGIAGSTTAGAKSQILSKADLSKITAPLGPALSTMLTSSVKSAQFSSAFDEIIKTPASVKTAIAQLDAAIEGLGSRSSAAKTRLTALRDSLLTAVSPVPGGKAATVQAELDNLERRRVELLEEQNRQQRALTAATTAGVAQMTAVEMDVDEIAHPQDKPTKRKQIPTAKEVGTEIIGGVKGTLLSLKSDETGAVRMPWAGPVEEENLRKQRATLEKEYFDTKNAPPISLQDPFERDTPRRALEDIERDIARVDKELDVYQERRDRKAQDKEDRRSRRAQRRGRMAAPDVTLVPTADGEEGPARRGQSPYGGMGVSGAMMGLSMLGMWAGTANEGLAEFSNSLMMASMGVMGVQMVSGTVTSSLDKLKDISIKSGGGMKGLAASLLSPQGGLIAAITLVVAAISYFAYNLQKAGQQARQAEENKYVLPYESMGIERKSAYETFKVGEGETPDQAEERKSKYESIKGNEDFQKDVANLGAVSEQGGSKIDYLLDKASMLAAVDPGEIPKFVEYLDSLAMSGAITGSELGTLLAKIEALSQEKAWKNIERNITNLTKAYNSSLATNDSMGLEGLQEDLRILEENENGWAPWRLYDRFLGGHDEKIERATADWEGFGGSVMGVLSKIFGNNSIDRIRNVEVALKPVTESISNIVALSDSPSMMIGGLADLESSLLNVGLDLDATGGYAEELKRQLIETDPALEPLIQDARTVNEILRAIAASANALPKSIQMTWSLQAQSSLLGQVEAFMGTLRSGSASLIDKYTTTAAPAKAGESYDDKIKALQKADKAAEKAQKAEERRIDDLVKAKEKEIDKYDDLIEKIDEEADAKRKALEDAKDATDFMNDLRQADIDYYDALARGDYAQAASVQNARQGLIEDQSYSQGLEDIDEEAERKKKPYETAIDGIQSEIDKLQELLDEKKRQWEIEDEARQAAIDRLNEQKDTAVGAAEAAAEANAAANAQIRADGEATLQANLANIEAQARAGTLSKEKAIKDAQVTAAEVAKSLNLTPKETKAFVDSYVGLVKKAWTEGLGAVGVELDKYYAFHGLSDAGTGGHKSDAAEQAAVDRAKSSPAYNTDHTGGKIKPDHTTGKAGLKGNEVHRILEVDEYVIQKDAVKKYGTDFFASLNDMKMHTGGQVKKGLGKGIPGPFRRGVLSPNMIGSMMKRMIPIIDSRLAGLSAGGEVPANLPGVDLGDLLFIKPLRSGYRKTSGYGMRTNPVTKKKAFHYGIDMAAPEGTPIYATEAGRIVQKQVMAAVAGNAFRISHRGGWDTRYLHMSSFEKELGDLVRKGEVIGRVGTTGRSTGPHLHFEMRKEGKNLDPTTVLSLRKGAGNINFDNVLANLHKGETVLTSPLSAELKDGISKLNSTPAFDSEVGGDNVHMGDRHYNIVVNAAPGMSEEAVANRVFAKIERRESRVGYK